jgi:hypothetical protein
MVEALALPRVIESKKVVGHFAPHVSAGCQLAEKMNPTSENALRTKTCSASLFELLFRDLTCTEIFAQKSEGSQRKVNTVHGTMLHEKTPNPLKITDSFPLRFEEVPLFDNRPPEKRAARQRVEGGTGQVVQSGHIRTPIAQRRSL